jgi:ABC-2 type transport system ATP-binding protein
MTMINVENLTKRYGHVTAVDALSFAARPGHVTGFSFAARPGHVTGFSFAARPGHVTGFLGPNGAGKTTTMRVILGLDRPTSGAALVRGRRYQEIIRPLHEVGVLLDATAVHPGRTARSHLLSIASSNGIGRRRVAQVLDWKRSPTAGSRASRWA